MPFGSVRLTWSNPGSRQNYYKDHCSAPIAQCAKTAPRIRQTAAHVPGIFALLSEQPRRILHYKGIYRHLSPQFLDGAIAGTRVYFAFMTSSGDQVTENSPPASDRC